MALSPSLSSPSLLPFNASAMERAIEAAARPDILPVPITQLWNADTCPEPLLPWLAWALHVDEFDDIPTEAGKREAIRLSLALHRKKGTPWAIQRALAGQFIAEWRAAGGELLDGVGLINGTGDLSTPGGNFRFATTSWAEYALRLNVADGSTSRAMLRHIAQVCAAYAPARSHLVAILLFAAAHFDAMVRLTGFSARGRTVFNGCRRFTIPDFDTLDGCDIIGGETLLDTLDGGSRLDGASILLPERYMGEPLDGGQLSIRVPAARVTLSGTTLGGAYIELPDTLDNSDFLDGASTLSGETLDATTRLDGGDLRYPLLSDGEDVLDGTSNLGEIPAPETIAFWGKVRIRHKSLITQEPL